MEHQGSAAANVGDRIGGVGQGTDTARAGCKKAGLGSIVAPGLGGFTTGATGGSLLMNSAGVAGLYSRSRGRGADAMLLTSAGLWVASDNFGGSTSCGGQAGYAGICFLPYTS